MYPWSRGLLIYYRGGSVFTIVYQILYQLRTPLSLRPYSCCDVEVLALTDGGRDFGAKGGSALCNKRRSHVIEKGVPLTWKKYYNYQKIWGVLVMSTTGDNDLEQEKAV